MTHMGRILCILFGCLATGLILRHDVPDKRFLALARGYPQLCHFPMGEGTLIGPSWVLTAGHVGRDLGRDLAHGMTPRVRCGGREYAIDTVIVHPGFRDTEGGLEHDIALVRLAESVTGVTPAAIYRRADEAGRPIVLVGAGDVGNGRTGPRRSDNLPRAATNTVETADSLWISFTFDPPGAKEATPLEGISGPGDSGGPAFCDVGRVRYVVGVSSHQRSPKGKGRYGAVEYYSRVSRESAWILRTITP